MTLYFFGKHIVSFMSELNMMSFSKLKDINFDQIPFKLFLWFHRIIGMSFGGFATDSNGRIFSNKWFKFYGIIFTIIRMTYDLTYHWTIGEAVNINISILLNFIHYICF